MRYLLAAICSIDLVGAVLAVPDALPDTPALPSAPAPRAVKPKFSAPKLNNVYEVLVFTTQRPVRIRVTALTEGKPMDELWRERLKKLFDFCDRDDDGFLSEKETKNAFSDQGMAQLLANGYYQPGAANAPRFAELDKNSDGKVSFEEFIASYPRTMSQLFRTLPVQPDNSNNAAVTETLFKLLDLNNDGKLTQDEVKSVEKLLASHDADEDECLSVSELVPNLTDQFGRPVRIPQPGRMGTPYPAGPAAQIVAVYQAGLIPGTATQHVIKKYDKDGDFDLTQEEIGFDDLTFRTLDKNGDGKLDGEEFDVWRTGPPDLEVTLTFAANSSDCSATMANEKAAESRGFKLNHVSASRLVIRVGRQPIDLWATPPAPQFNQGSLKQQFGYLFAQAAGVKGHVTEKDLNGPNAVQFQFVRVIFEAADRDADGKLTKAEFDAYFDLQDSFRNLSLTLSPGIQTPSLFQLLDENRDGRLSVRELRTAWTRLQALEGPNAEVVTKNIIQPSVTLRLSRSYDRFYVNQPVFINDRNMNRVPVPQKGPLWFRKMDRNGDGDVSRTEFLGTKEEFDAIDTDHDDLISLEEAEAFDQKMREKEKDKDKEPPAPPKPDKPKPGRKQQEK